MNEEYGRLDEARTRSQFMLGSVVSRNYSEDHPRQENNRDESNKWNYWQHSHPFLKHIII